MCIAAVSIQTNKKKEEEKSIAVGIVSFLRFGSLLFSSLWFPSSLRFSSCLLFTLVPFFSSLWFSSSLRFGFLLRLGSLLLFASLWFSSSLLFALVPFFSSLWFPSFLLFALVTFFSSLRFGSLLRLGSPLRNCFFPLVHF